MATQAEIQCRLDTIDAQLRSGVQFVSTDGTSTTVNLAELRMERDRLQKTLTTYKASRPVTARIDLGGF